MNPKIDLSEAAASNQKIDYRIKTQKKKYQPKGILGESGEHAPGWSVFTTFTL